MGGGWGGEGRGGGQEGLYRGGVVLSRHVSPDGGRARAVMDECGRVKLTPAYLPTRLPACLHFRVNTEGT